MRDRDAETINRFMRDVQGALKNHEQRLLECQQGVTHLFRQSASQANQSNAGQTMDALKRDSEHYAQVVMLAGYAGFFTLWTQTRHEMSLWMFASTGALISISLMVFVLFELHKTWQIGRAFSGRPPFIDDDVNAALAAANRYWRPAFLISSTTGLVAGISLLLWFVYKSVVAAAAAAGAA